VRYAGEMVISKVCRSVDDTQGMHLIGPQFSKQSQHGEYFMSVSTVEKLYVCTVHF
jgi:hypothetical protein